jgi:hypothetical protein
VVSWCDDWCRGVMIDSLVSIVSSTLGFSFGGTSSSLCKEGGIDGLVDPRTGVSEWIVLTH